MNVREAEIEERHQRRIDRWWRNLSHEQREAIKADTATRDRLRSEGYIGADDLLTPAGELYMHQLDTLQWMSTRYECFDDPVHGRRLRRIPDRVDVSRLTPEQAAALLERL